MHYHSSSTLTNLELKYLNCKWTDTDTSNSRIFWLNAISHVIFKNGNIDVNMTSKKLHLSHGTQIKNSLIYYMTLK